jgi:hypothetical protein
MVGNAHPTKLAMSFVKPLHNLRSQDPQIVLCSGMVRSASTWSYNACRHILQGDPWPTVAGFFGEQTQVDRVIASTDLTANNLLIKAHLPSEPTHAAIAEGVIKNIFTYRDPRDSLSSRITFEGCDVEEFQDFLRVLSIVRVNLQLMDRYQSGGRSLFIPFDQVMNAPAAEIARIAAYLNRELTPDRCQEIAAEISVDRARQVVGDLDNLTPSDTFQAANRTIERTTLLQTGHINGAKTGRWRDDLTPEQQLASHLSLRRWLLELGYETEETWLHQLDRSLNQVNWRGVAQDLQQQDDYGSAFQLFARAIEQEIASRDDMFDYITLAALCGDREAAGLAWWSYIADRDLLELSAEVTALQARLIDEAIRQEALGTAVSRDRAAAVRDCLADLDE